MSRKPYMTSTELINAVKRKIAMPITQVTFSNDDILQFANEEMFLSQVPSVLQYHQEYYVADKFEPLVDNVSVYDIPSRAIGMKLRDLFYVDTNNNYLEMVNVGPSNSDIFRSNNSGSTPRNFHVQGNSIVLLPDVKSGATGSLLMKYYLRPNSLVENDRAAICTSFAKIVTIDNTTLTDGDTISIGSQTLTVGTDFEIGATNTGTAANLTTAVNTLSGITSTSTSSDVTILFRTLSTSFTTSNSAAFIIDEEVGIRADSIPENFIDGMKIDFLQTSGGHNTLAFDVTAGTGSVTSDTVYFHIDEIPSKFVVGDYLCEQHECIIPQIPSDLHTLLAERTCMRILEALGDTQGAQTQMTKVGDLEARQAVIIDNRTEGAPRKIFNRHSLLRSAKRRRSF